MNQEYIFGIGPGRESKSFLQIIRYEEILSPNLLRSEEEYCYEN
jgi:hypothetical protein